MLACTHSSCRFRKVLVALGARGRRSAERARPLPTPRPPSRRPALPEPESGRARPLPAGGGRAAESRREGLWAQLAVPAVSSATTPGACACVCVGSGSAVPWQRPQNPAPTRRLFAACSPEPPTSGSPHLRPISNQFPGWPCLVGMGVSAWWSGQPQVGELGYRVGWGGAACLRLEAQQRGLGGTAGCGQARIQGPHVKHTVPSQLLAPHHWGAQTLV